MFRKQLDLPAKKFKHFKQLVVMSRYTGETFESAVVEKPKHVVIGTYSVSILFISFPSSFPHLLSLFLSQVFS